MINGLSGCRKTYIIFKNGVSSVACQKFCIVQNFWQATKASLLWGVAPVQVVSHLCHCICALTAICAVASCNGFVWLTASILAWSRGGSPTLSPGMDAGRVCPRALQGRKANQAYTAFHRGKGAVRHGCRNKDTPSFARGKAIRVS